MLASLRLLKPDVAASNIMGKIGNKTRTHGVANRMLALLLSTISIGQILCIGYQLNGF